MLKESSVRVNKRDTHQKVQRIKHRVSETGYTIKDIYSFMINFHSEAQWVKMIKDEGDV